MVWGLACYCNCQCIYLCTQSCFIIWNWIDNGDQIVQFILKIATFCLEVFEHSFLRNKFDLISLFSSLIYLVKMQYGHISVSVIFSGFFVFVRNQTPSILTFRRTRIATLSLFSVCCCSIGFDCSLPAGRNVPFEPDHVAEVMLIYYEPFKFYLHLI